MMLFLAACGSSSENKTEEKMTEVAESSFVEHLDYNTFKEKVWDFKKNPEEFQYKGELPAIVDFYADWCKPCKMIAPYMEEIAEQYDGKLKVYKIDTQVEKELARALRVRGLPTVMFIPKEGQPMTQMGAMPKEEYIKKVNELTR